MKPSRNSSVALLIVGCLVAVVAAEDSVRPTASALETKSTNAAASTPGRCTVRQDDNGWWLVSPDGEPFFSLGVCMLNQGLEKDPAKPSYAAHRHYHAPEKWADVSLLRLKSWGFTTAAGWSDYATLRRSAEQDFWITPVLHLGSKVGLPWFDMWDEKNIRRVEEIAVETMVPLRGDSRVIGYYSDNEIGWWNAILWKMALKQPATSGQRQRLIAMVKEVYGNDWNRLAQDFEPQNASSWDELDRGGMLWLKPGSNGIRTVRKFLALAADRYYQLMRETIRKYDPDALYLGDRYQSFYYPELPIASRRHVDIVSTNLNASWNDGTFIKSYLDTLHELSGKPVMVSEFYMAAVENRSGNRNAVGGFPIVVDQKQRAEALSNTVRALVGLPYVVGADWFQYYDEPPHGRTLDGEDYNFGLVDIHDQPYAEVTAAFASLNLSELKSAKPAARTDATDGVPPAPANPMDAFEAMTALKHWDRVRGLVPAVTEHPLGDLYICWSPDALYLGTFVFDIVEPDYYRDAEIPEVDRALWTIHLEGRKPVTARIGSGKDPVISDPAVGIKALSGTYHDVRCITVVKVPAGHFGKDAFKPGDRVSIKTNYTTHGRAHQIDWKGTFLLSE